MAITYKIFNSRTGVEVEETKALDETVAGDFYQWLEDNNTCYEESDENRPEDDACDYEMKVYDDGAQRWFNPDTQEFDLTSEPAPTAEEE